MPPVILSLFVVNLVCFWLMGVLGDEFVRRFALWPGAGPELLPLPWSAPWQLLTYGFLHGGVGHIALNLFGLWMFGSDLERLWGGKRLLAVYLSSVLAGGLCQILITPLFGGAVGPVVGASGGVFGLMLAFAMVFPNRTVLLLIPPIPMPARVFVVLYASVELTLGVTGSSLGVAHFAHLGGMLGAWLAIQHARGRFPFDGR
jgi:membrane associated rhomboid family serine protease